MPEYRVTNPKGLFHEPCPSPLMTERVFERLRDHVAPSTPDPKLRAERMAAIEAVGKLPVFVAFSYYCEHDDGFEPKPKGWSAKTHGDYASYGRAPCRAWMDVGPAKGASPSSNFPCGSPEEAGWLAIGAASKHAAAIEAMLAEAGAPPNPLATALSSAGAAAKRRLAMKLTFSEVDLDSEMMSSKAVALFVDRGADAEGRPAGGFLDAKGGFGPMSRARLFESASAAARTAASQRLPAWKAVGVSMGLDCVHEMPGDSPCARVDAAMARHEAASIDRALREAGAERLRARLAELEAEQPPEPARKPAKARL